MLRLTAAGAALIAVTYGLARFALGLFVPELRTSLGLSSTDVGWVMAASYGGYLVALVVAGGTIDVHGPRRVAVAAGVLATMGTLGVALAHSVGSLAAVAGLGGASTGLASASLAAAVQAQLAPPHRAVSQTVVNAATSLGLLVAAPVAVAAGGAWRLAWLGFAGLAAIATLAAAAAVADRPAPTVRIAPTAATGHARDTAPSSGRHRRFRGGPVLPSLVPGAAAVLLGLASATFWAFGREILELLVGLDATAGRLVWAAVGVGGLAGALAGAGAERFGLRGMLTVAWLASATGHLSLALGGPGAPSAWVATALVGAAYMALTGLLIVWSVAEHPTRPGAAVAGVFLLLAMGQAAGSPAMGALVDRAGLAPTVLVAAVLAATGPLLRPRRSRSTAMAAGGGAGPRRLT